MRIKLAHLHYGLRDRLPSVDRQCNTQLNEVTGLALSGSSLSVTGNKDLILMTYHEKELE